MAALTPAAVVALTGSAGCMPIVVDALKTLEVPSDLAVFVLYHRGGQPFDLSIFLPKRSPFGIHPAEVEATVERGRVYHARDGMDLAVEEGRIVATPPAMRWRPNIDRLLESLARTYGRRVTAILLSGASAKDGVEGLRRVRAAGGHTIAQDPEDAMFRTLPEAAIHAGAASSVMGSAHIVEHVRHVAHAFALAPSATDRPS